MKAQKRIFSVFMCMMMVLSTLFMTVSAEQTQEQTINEEQQQTAPTAITISHNAKNIIDGKVIAKKGDVFKLTAHDQDGNETPVTWKNTSYGGGGVEIDETTGVVTVTDDVYSGSTSFLYFTATSVLDESVTKQINVQAGGYLLSDYQKNPTVTLSEDGQTAKTVSVTAGFKGHNIWEYTVPEGIAEVVSEPGTDNTAKFNAFRPGIFDVVFKLDINEELTDTATVTINGVAVEDSEGNRGKTYLCVSSENPKPTVQLSAYFEEDRTLGEWTSADEAVATVDENGLVTAVGIGNTIISAVDSEGSKGGIKLVVSSEDIPYFESMEFNSVFSDNAWIKNETFSPTKLTYDLPIKTYSTSSLTLQSTTVYDTEKYTAIAEYTDINGEKQAIEIKSGAMTTLPNQPFGESVMTITLSDRNDSDKKTVYIFNVSRPRDTTKKIKNSGIVIVPEGRGLSQTKYNGVAEGTMQKADENGELTSGTGVSSSQMYYSTFIYNDIESFKINLTASTVYAHIRYSLDNGENWTYIGQNSGTTNEIKIPQNTAEILVQISDDKTYVENSGVFEGEPAEYKVWIKPIELTKPEILSASTEYGDFYPAFSSDLFSYNVMVENNAEAPVLTFTAEEGTAVTVGTNTLTPDEDGNYSLTLKTANQTVTVTSADGDFSSAYTFKFAKKSKFNVPDKVVDYLCMGSQYTNGSYGVSPETTLSGSLKSLGNFGGYITYYYEEPITDNPKNKYGMDFYVTGNSQEMNIDSMAELGQVYVSEDNETWYALAGSEHYEDKAIWDYTITYTKTADGKAAWTDNRGSIMTNSPCAWPSKSVYCLNNTADSDIYTFTGVLFESQQGSVTGDSSQASFAAEAEFGYADYYASNITASAVTDVNPYMENPSKANGFDVAWAVDKEGNPVDVSEKKFHYIKVATASNIWAGSFREKSTEVAYVVRTTAQEGEVGKTTAPTGVTISDGAESKTVLFNENTNIYNVNIDNMKYVSVAVNGTSADDNIYINNTRVADESIVSGFKITKEGGEKLIRIIVQNGDKEPAIYLLKLAGNVSESDEALEGIKINADGAVREATTNDGKAYSLSVGHKISNIVITPIIAPEVTYKVNGKEASGKYELQYGKNTFEIEVTNGEKTETVFLTVTRENTPISSGNNITVKFTLYGDEKHGEDEVHTYKNNKKNLPVWIEQKSYTVSEEATVLDVFEIALKEADITWKNAGGNYISEINGLAEFDNGALSGWMYFLNSNHSSFGIAEQRLKNGDKIIFHYTDDYTQEQGSESFVSIGNGSPVKTKEETNDEKTEEKENETTTHEKKEFFSDVEESAWYYEAVKYVNENGLMQGTDKGFEPELNMTRAMLVTVLYRMENEKLADGVNRFSDVSEGMWYSDAILWADKKGIVKGISETEFAPNDNITREQLALIIYRYALLKGYDTENKNELSEFEDLSEISDWALEAINWANADGIMQGTDKTTISPKASATRAQIAAIIMRLAQRSKK